MPRTFADLSSAQRQLAAKPQTDFFSALGQGFQQGQDIQNLPQTIQDQQLDSQLRRAIMTQKLYELQHPDEALTRQIQRAVLPELVSKGLFHPETGVVSAPQGLEGQIIGTPKALSLEQQSSLPSSGGGDVPHVAPGAPETPISVLGKQTGFNLSPETAEAAKASDLQDKISLINAAHPEKTVTPPRLEAKDIGNAIVFSDPYSGKEVNRIPKNAAQEIDKKPDGSVWVYNKGDYEGGHIVPGTEPSQNQTVSGFNPEAIDRMVDEYRLSGKVPSLGASKGVNPARAAFWNRVASKSAELQETVGDAIEKRFGNQADSKSLAKLQPLRDQIVSAEDTANKNLQLALGLAEKVDDTGSPLLNRWVRASEKDISGNPELAAFDTAIRTAANEIAKVTSFSMGNSAVTDSARSEIDGVLNKNMTLEQLKAVAPTLQKDMENRRLGLDGQLQKISERIRTRSGGGGAQNSPASETPSNGKKPTNAQEFLSKFNKK
jgi:hypothetical protein